MNTNKAILVLSGYNPRAILAFLRVCETYSIPYYIIATGENDLILETDYAKKVAHIRENTNIVELLSICRKIIQDNNLSEAWILPSTEFLNRYLLENRDNFEKEKIHVPLVSKVKYELISDKLRFRNLCIENNLPVTTQYQDISQITYPCVLKPKTYWSHIGKPIIFSSYDELSKENKCFNEWFTEEYISGDSYYLLYYFRKDGTYISYSQQNLIQQPDGGSILLAKSANLHNENICTRYAQIFQMIKYHGPVMVEVKKKDKNYVLIEANPRLWGPSQLCVDAEIPIIAEYIADMGFEINIKRKTHDSVTYYLWTQGFPSNINTIKYYSYNENEFLSQYDELMMWDVYNHNDTKKVFDTKKINNYGKEDIL